MDTITEVPEKLKSKLEELFSQRYMVMPDGIYCFSLESEKEIQLVVDELGINYFYVLGVHLESKTVKKKTEEVATPALYAVNNQPLGYSVVRQSEKPAKEWEGSEAIKLRNDVAGFHLPKIPKLLVDTAEGLFRKVDADNNGSESVIVLTYDKKLAAKEGNSPSDGWGFIVPEQNNNAVHCHYSPTSAAQLKPPTARIVGTIHSHPGMSAHASSTDHGDQEHQTDGIHMTIGWSGTVTEYWAELHFDDRNYIFAFDQIVHSEKDLPEPDPEWLERIGKAEERHTSTPFGGGSHGSDKYWDETDRAIVFRNFMDLDDNVFSKQDGAASIMLQRVAKHCPWCFKTDWFRSEYRCGSCQGWSYESDKTFFDMMLDESFTPFPFLQTLRNDDHAIYCVESTKVPMNVLNSTSNAKWVKQQRETMREATVAIYQDQVMGVIKGVVEHTLGKEVVKALDDFNNDQLIAWIVANDSDFNDNEEGGSDPKA